MNSVYKAEPNLIPDIELFEERVAIMIYDGGLSDAEAKELAAKAQGYECQDHYWDWLRDYVERQSLV